jgi:hypothetical protein
MVHRPRNGTSDFAIHELHTVALNVSLMLLLGAAAFAQGASGPNANAKACKLLTSAEIQSAFGTAPSRVVGMDGTVASNCTMLVGNYTVKLQHVIGQARQIGMDTGVAMKGAEQMLQEAGFQTESKQFDGTRCMSARLGKQIKSSSPVRTAVMTPSTNCWVVKGNDSAAVEVAARNGSQVWSMEQVKPLAEKAATRIP